MPVPLRVSIDQGTPVTIAAAGILLQGTNSASKPIRLKRMQLQSNNTGATQQIITVSFGFYVTGSAGGSVVAAVPVDEGLTGVYSPATVFKAGPGALGTTFTEKATWQWLSANPFDIVYGMEALMDEIPVSKVWAFISSAAITSCSISGTLNYEEFG